MASRKMNPNVLRSGQFVFKEKTRGKRQQSLYFPVSIPTFIPAKSAYERPRKIINNYVFEFDVHEKSDNYHFHIWKASANKCRLSDTRSEAVSVFEGIVDGKTTLEERDNRKISEQENSALLEFLEDEDKRLSIFFMAVAKNRGYKIQNPALNIDELCVEIPDKDLSELTRKYNAQMGNKKAKQK